MIRDLARTLAQAGDPSFRGVLLRGIGAALLLLILLGATFLGLLRWLLPESVTLPLVGAVGWLDEFAAGTGVLVYLVLSVFLMVPVASAVMGLLLDDVTDAVEARWYPEAGPARRLGLLESAGDALRFFGILVLANLVALVLYVAFPPAAPFLFYGLNGYLLGREYFQLVAARRLGREGAARMRRRHGARIRAAGALMAVPLSVPILNLAVPVLGAASFTHLYHRLAGAPSGPTSRGRAR